jgi:hypothetical protein
MATFQSVIVPTGGDGKSMAAIAAGVSETGVTEDGNLGADGVSGGVTDRAMMGVAGLAVTIDDATYVDPGTGAVDTEQIHSHQYPGTRTDFDNGTKNRSYALAATATAGTPGTYNGRQPEDIGELLGVAASPATLWTVGQSVEVVAGAADYHWDSTAWVAGTAP